MKTVDHPPYSPDLAPADFWFFPLLKSQIRGKIFPSVPALQDALMQEISKIPRSAFHDCIHNRLPNCWRKCITAQGDYFEGNELVIPSDTELLDSSSESSDSE